MNINPELVKKKFSEEMKRCCLKKYKVIPSNAKLAKDFYYATKYQLKINQETFRLWKKGESFPDLKTLLHLINWLELNLNNIFDFNQISQKNSEQKREKLNFESTENLNIEDIDSLINILSSVKNGICKKIYENNLQFKK